MTAEIHTVANTRATVRGRHSAFQGCQHCSQKASVPQPKIDGYGRDGYLIIYNSQNSVDTFARRVQEGPLIGITILACLRITTQLALAINCVGR